MRRKDQKEKLYNSMTEAMGAFTRIVLEFDDTKIDSEVHLRQLILKEIKSFNAE
jgi:hypothetical protein